MSIKNQSSKLLEIWDPKYDAKIDIIFVHGLRGDRIKTWTYPSSNVFWPRDLLPENCPLARILSFGYNATLDHFYPPENDNTEQLTIQDDSTELFHSLIELRQRTGSYARPLVFVAHNLGGFVCASLLSSRLHASSSRDISIATATAHHAKLSEKTIGIIFLGTPLERELGGMAKIYARAGLKILDAMNITHSETLGDLKKRSAKLVGIKEAFEKYRQERNDSGNLLEVLACYESDPTVINEEKSGFYVVQRGLSRFMFSHLYPMHISIPGNHVEMCKFENEFSEGFETIAKRLNQLYKRARVEELQKRPKPFIVPHTSDWYFGPTASPSSMEPSCRMSAPIMQQPAPEPIRHPNYAVSELAADFDHEDNRNSYVFSIRAPTGPGRPEPGLPPPDDED